MCEAEHLMEEEIIYLVQKDEFEKTYSDNNSSSNKVVKARKIYIYDSCKSRIKIGEKYQRINVNYGKIYHFCLKCKKKGGIL